MIQSIFSPLLEALPYVYDYQVGSVYFLGIIMAKKKGNRESKKPKQQSDGSKKQKKDPKRHDDPQANK